MKKSLLNSIAKNLLLTELFSVVGILSLLGLLSFPFMGLPFMAFFCAFFAPVCFVFMSQYEANLFSDLKEAKRVLGLSIFTNDKALLKKCLQVKKSI
jgi:glucan phosphoethanolaminetransferase (alkaline phosphatase superfamily)